MATQQELVQLLQNGASLDLGSRGGTTGDMVQLAMIAGNSGTKIIMRATRPIDDLLQIARAGDGAVTFRFE